MKAMILAAGLGTRLKPFTDSRPKALFPIYNRTLLEWTIRYLKKHSINELVINVHHFPDQIIDFLKKNKGFGLSYTISNESEMLMNTGGAVVKASEYLKGNQPFILIGTDVLTDLDLSKMIHFHDQNKPLVTLAVKNRLTSRSLLFSDQMQLVGWRDNTTGCTIGNKAGMSIYTLGFSAVHIIQPKIFSLIKELGAFSIIDLYLRIMDAQKIIGFRHDEDVWFEFGRTSSINSLLNNPELKRLLSTL